MILSREYENVVDPENDQWISLGELSVVLKDRGVINRDRKTLHRWATVGVVRDGTRVRLRTEWIANTRHTTLTLFFKFLEQQS